MEYNMNSICMKNRNETAGTTSEIRRQERVAIFVDTENVIKSFKDSTPGIRARIDFGAMRELLAGGRKVSCSRAYSGYSPYYGISPFLRSMEEAGFHLDLEEVHGPAQKGVDVSMALDLVDTARYTPCDTVILVSGDADFRPAVRRVKGLGKKVQVASFESALSPSLAEEADEVTILDRLRMVDPDSVRVQESHSFFIDWDNSPWNGGSVSS